MAQFDVYKNPSNTTQRELPFLVDIQSSLLEQLETRIVIPLVRLSTLQNQGIPSLYPEFSYENQQLALLTTQVSGIHKALLKQPIGTLAQQRDTILKALDFAISGF